MYSYNYTLYSSSSSHTRAGSYNGVPYIFLQVHELIRLKLDQYRSSSSSSLLSSYPTRSVVPYYTDPASQYINYHTHNRLITTHTQSRPHIRELLRTKCISPSPPPSSSFTIVQTKRALKKSSLPQVLIPLGIIWKSASARASSTIL